jgi:exopolyphosphatase/guanosine-5'-triphosphate,3'-diphosphate pyrophosphatase
VRVAIVDIGTNSTRLLIADVDAGRVCRELTRRTQVTRLGDGVDANGRLDEAAMARVEAVLERYRAEIDDQGAEAAVAVLTSAAREAGNGGAFADRVSERYRLDAYVIEGEQEARLTFLGATAERTGASDAPVLVIDIGGGSTELIVGPPGGEPSFHVSTRAGVVRQTERHLHDDPPTGAEVCSLVADARATIEAAVPAAVRRDAGAAIAVAGTATSLAALDQCLEPYDPARVHGHRLTRDRTADMLSHLSVLDLDGRRALPGLHPDRAPTIVAGVAILLEALDAFGLDAFEASEHDILRGAAVALGPAGRMFD